jgi:hypothetical protein
VLSVNVAYAEWGSRNRATSLQETLKCIAAAGGTVHQIVIADNKLECSAFPGEYAGRTKVISGDNFAREFSAWDRAYAALDDKAGADVVLCVNDTFAAHRRARMARRLRIARWLQVAGNSSEPEMFGQLDPAIGAPAEWIFGELSTYISSYLFGLTPSAAELLFPLTAVDAQIDGLLNQRFSPTGLFSEGLPLPHRRRIEEWLFTPGNWRNSAPLSAENFEFFRLKAKSILYEYALTSRARSAGIKVSDLFAGRGWIDEIAGSLGKAWMTNTSMLKQSLSGKLKRS